MIDEQEVLITPDGLGRSAIVRRSDGLFCVYAHWIWDKDTKVALNAEPGGRATWVGDRTPLHELYEEIEPEPGIYGTLDDARRALLALPGFANAKAIK